MREISNNNGYRSEAKWTCRNAEAFCKVLDGDAWRAVLFKFSIH